MKKVSLLNPLKPDIAIALEERLSFETIIQRNWRWSNEFEPIHSWWLLRLNRDVLREVSSTPFHEIANSLYVTFFPERYEPWGGSIADRLWAEERIAEIVDISND